MKLKVEKTFVSLPLRGEISPVDTGLVSGLYKNWFSESNLHAHRFLLRDRKTGWLARRPDWTLLAVPVPAESCLAWHRPVHAAFAGRVVARADGMPDRRLAGGIGQRTPPANPEEARRAFGNFVVIEGAEGFALYAHLAPSTESDGAPVALGDEVALGEVIGRIGCSGAARVPHLRFDLMDGPDVLRAARLPSAFANLEALLGTSWQVVRSGVPSPFRFIRARHA